MDNSLESHLREILNVVEPNSEHLTKTPKRSAKAYQELLNGYGKGVSDVVSKDAIYESSMEDMVILRRISFESFCEHHMIAITGYASVGYIPNGYIIGASKIARIVDCFAHRLQLQERLTTEIATAIDDVLSPKGVAVFVEGKHFCISNRGIKKQDARLVTRCFVGEFKNNYHLRQEFLQAI